METEGRWRLTLLCEDRRTERFIRGLCDQFGNYRVDVIPVPGGRGDAARLVLRNCVDEVRKLRSRNYQRFLGLLIVIDGDGVGWKGRLNEIDAELQAAGVAPRADAEPIAVFSPTWSIETWLAFLSRGTGVSEDQSTKDDLAFRELWSDGKAERATLRTAVLAWPGIGVRPDSLAAAVKEGRRVGLAG